MSVCLHVFELVQGDEFPALDSEFVLIGFRTHQVMWFISDVHSSYNVTSFRSICDHAGHVIISAYQVHIYITIINKFVVSSPLIDYSCMDNFTVDVDLQIWHLPDIYAYVGLILGGVTPMMLQVTDGHESISEVNTWNPSLLYLSCPPVDLTRHLVVTDRFSWCFFR